MTTRIATRPEIFGGLLACVCLLLLGLCGCGSLGGGGDARDLARTGARALDATRENLDAATSGVLTTASRRAEAATLSNGDAALPHEIERRLVSFERAGAARDAALLDLGRAHVVLEQIDRGGPPEQFDEALAQADASAAAWRRDVHNLAAAGKETPTPSISPPRPGWWSRAWSYVFGPSVDPDAERASLRLASALEDAARTLAAERAAAVALQRASAEIRLADNLALWRAGKLDLAPFVEASLDAAPKAVRKAARDHVKPSSGYGGVWATRRMTEYLDDEDAALAGVYHSGEKTLVRLARSHRELAAGEWPDRKAIKRAVEKMDERTQTFKSAP